MRSDRQKRAVGTALISPGPALVANSLCQRAGKRTLHKARGPNRKFLSVERGKGILQRDLGLSEEEAYLVLERQSRQKCRPMKEVAQAIISSDEVRRSSLQPEKNIGAVAPGQGKGLQTLIGGSIPPCASMRRTALV